MYVGNFTYSASRMFGIGYKNSGILEYIACRNMIIRDLLTFAALRLFYLHRCKVP